jgi:hypothetical protein
MLVHQRWAQRSRIHEAEHGLDPAAALFFGNGSRHRFSSWSAASWKKWPVTLNKAAIRLNEIRNILFTQGQAKRQISASRQINARFHKVEEVEVFQAVLQTSEIID